MKAIYYEKYGGIDQLMIRDLPRPQPLENEVLVRVKASSINSWDYDRLTGTPGVYRLLFGLNKPGIKILGCDVAGVVEAVGSQVTRFKPGDRVFGDLSGDQWGCFAEYTVAPEEMLALIPDEMSDEEAASLPQAGVLALQGLRLPEISFQNKNILLVGAGGGVGTFAIQIAKKCGAEITVIDKGSKLPALLELGADHAIDYQKNDFAGLSPSSFDLILDVVVQRGIREYERLLTREGSLVMIGGNPGKLLGIVIASFLKKSGGRNFRVLGHKPNKTDLDSLSRLFQEGKLKPVIDRVYSLEEVPQALDRIGKGDVIGKVVVKID